MKKADQEADAMPEDVAFFGAKNVRANVRELEGALRKILAYSRFSHKDINHPARARGTEDLLSIQNGRSASRTSKRQVADFYKIKVADMYSKKRPASIARRARFAMYIAKGEMNAEEPAEIGELFGGRDQRPCSMPCARSSPSAEKHELNQQLLCRGRR